ncbi:hypothetical protein HYH02_007415 [Chlamydomonas schloesseri]|uniref:BHLH domain-containing protein n=1 Tax=Chlamydomonas schloesseri TaxID=2026947 RepID=A0A836B4W3_9CHLO|nr:hypothetical protein HYH02_007415 [Chlamydomonas schloesseri]|eukprot:KAG2447488.1 hypothetical protein HYH02_007415 [Chlamydomonas schloesseri]
MQPTSLTGRQQQQLGLLSLAGRAQPDMLEAARVAALLNGQGGSFNLPTTGLGSGALSGQSLNLSLGSLPTSSLPQASQQAPLQQSSQLGLPDQLALLSGFPAALFPQQYGSGDRDLQLGGMRNAGKTKSSDSRSSSAYASRHQAAEQRRRTRINERLELLRKLVPHAERANTACFLEEVIKYIEALKARTLELESQLETLTGKPVPKSLPLPTGMPSVLGGGSNSADNTTASPRTLAVVGAATSSQGGPASSQPLGGQQGAGNGAGSLASPSNTPPPTMTAQQASQQLALIQAGGSGGLPAQLTLPSAGGGGVGAGLLSAAQQSLLGFPQSGGLSLAGAGLSLGGSGLGGHGTGSISLTQFAGNLQAAAAAAAAASHGAGSHSHGSHSQQHSGLSGLGTSSHHHHHVTASQQLSELQAVQMMQSLQQHHSAAAAAAAAASAGAGSGAGAGSSRPGAGSSTFHPTNNKAFLHFNEDAYGGAFGGGAGGKAVELSLPARSLLGAAAASAATPSTSLQLTTVQLPTDSNTLLQVETARKALSGSPVSSEESGVPLKKRKVLVL